MYAVIFKAELAQLDEHYDKVANQLRKKALSQFGCLAFDSCRDGLQEITISYWPSEEAIKTWKQELDHQNAQRQGHEKWYRHYTVEVANIERSYQSS